MSTPPVAPSVLRGSLLAACLALAPGSGGAQVNPGSPLPPVPPIPVDTFTLENGLHVVVSEDHSAPVVAVNLTWRVGSAHDPAGLHGFAHLFEHLLQEGTENLDAGEAGRRIEGVGGRWSAWTTPDRTVFSQVVPSNALELALWLNAERMGRLAITDQGFEYARGIVLEEWRTRVADRPYADAAQAAETANPAWQPYGHPVMGSPSQLMEADADEARDFYRRMYGPDNATLVVAGDVTVDRIRGLAGTWLGGLDARGSPGGLPDPVAVPRTGAGQRFVLEYPAISRPVAYLAYDVPPAGHDDEAALIVLFHLLADEPEGRLRRELVESGGVAEAVTASLVSRAGPGRMIFGALPARDVGAVAVQGHMERELARLLLEIPTEEEVARVRQRVTTDALAEGEGVEGRADLLQQARLHHGSATAVNGRVEAVEMVTPEDVQAVAARYLTMDNRTVVLVVPGEGRGGGS